MRSKVRFIESGGKLAVLEIEAALEHPLSHSLPRTLDELGMMIVARQTRRRARRAVQRVQIAEADGSLLSEQRRLELQSVLVTSAAVTPLPWQALAVRDAWAEFDHANDD
jgi:hypothetical protein